MDNFALEALVREITPSLLQKRIQRIKPLGEAGFALGLRTGEFLMISMERASPALFLANRVGSSQREASDWLLTLRKYLMGGRILNVRKEFSERRTLVELENYRHALSPERLSLVLDLIPGKTNALLLNENQEVLASFYPVSAHFRKGPEISKGQTYSAWAIDRITQADFQHWIQNFGALRRVRSSEPVGILSADNGEGPSKPVKTPVGLVGMSRYFLQEILCDGLSDPASLWERFQMLLKQVRHGPYSPQLYFPNGRKQSATTHGPVAGVGGPGGGSKPFVSPFPLNCLDGVEHSELPSMNEAAAEAYRITTSDASLLATQNSEISRVAALLKRKMRLLSNLREDLDRVEGAQIYKKYADLLFAHQDKSPPGKNRVKLIDLFDDDQTEIEILLDPKLSLIQNAVRYGKLYQKARRSIPLIASRIKRTEREIKALADARHSLAAATTQEGVRQAGNESRGMDMAKGETSKSDKNLRRAGQETDARAAHDNLVRKTAKSFVSSDGWTILVGKSSKDNDILTLKIAQSDDFWFHVAGYGGSHVVLKNPHKLAVPPRHSLLEAAQLAAYFSQARNSSKVEVHYTQKKFVSKPKGSKPGLVQLRDYKSVSIKPELLSHHPG